MKVKMKAKLKVKAKVKKRKYTFRDKTYWAKKRSPKKGKRVLTPEGLEAMRTNARRSRSIKKYGRTIGKVMHFLKLS